jgi:hypothetical protein
LAFNFNNDPFSPPGAAGRSPLPTAASAAGTSVSAAPSPAPADSQAGNAPAAAPVTSDNPQSAAFVRFSSCRWQQPAEEGNAAFCTHREVKPYAGSAGFDAEAWCPECQYYKLRRAPKKRSPSDDYTY